ncbi:MAG: MFS transporter [Acidobacteria bacterium]|nr:MFS transporter [Acidobacteriota bacterium]
MESSKNRGLEVLLHVVFFISGTTTVLIGQVLPILSTGFGLNDLQAGYFFPAQFGGSILGTLTTNWFGKRNNFVLAAVLGCVLMAAGVTAMTLSSFAGCLAGFFVNGLGVGLTLPSINMLILEMNPRRSASALSILNFCWGLGAIVCKPFVDATSTRTSILLTSLFLAVPLLIGASLIRLLPRESHLPAPTAEIRAPDIKPVAIWATGLAWTIAFFNFVHVGFESGMGGWMTTYADRVHGEPVTTLFSPTFLFFLFFVAGRGVAPVFLRYLDENKVLFLDLITMLIGMLIILMAGNLVWLSIGASITGFGTSSVFPTNLSRFTRTFGPSATRRATPLFICGTLGATAVTWVIGFVSNQAGSLNSAMFALLVCVILLLVLQIVLTLRSSNTKLKDS